MGSAVTRPSSGESFYLMSMTDKDISIWSDASQLRIGIHHNKPELFREIYLWDLHALSQRGTFRRISKTDKNWRRLWLGGFDDDAGSNVYKSLPTTFTVSSFNYIDASEYTYRGSFNISPLVRKPGATEDITTVTYDGERAIWQAMLFPGMPMLMASSLTGHKHYGPVFFRKISLKVTGKNALIPVELSADFIGGRAIKCPEMDIKKPDLEETEIEGELYPGSTENTEDYVPYRSATMQDCLVATGVYKTITELKEALNLAIELETQEPQTRIVAFDIQMSQEVEFQVTGSKGKTSDKDGPRFASIKDRQVSGSVSYFSRSEEIIVSNSEDFSDTSELTMYFGGPFLLPMSNVEWQKPTLSVVPGEGWVHNYRFVARAANEAIAIGFKESDKPVSEFEFPTVEIEEE